MDLRDLDVILHFPSVPVCNSALGIILHSCNIKQGPFKEEKRKVSYSDTPRITTAFCCSFAWQLVTWFFFFERASW